MINLSVLSRMPETYTHTHTHTYIHAHTLTAQLESASMQVYWNSGETSDSTKLNAKVLVDAKVLN